MSQPDALTGVVEPKLIDIPEDRHGTAFEDAHSRAELALEMTRERLRDLRKHREEINAEIKGLVDDEELLERMTKVRRKP